MLGGRLEGYDGEVAPVVDHDFIQPIYFTGPSGIALKASYWVKGATEETPGQSDAFLLSDPDPVPALNDRLPFQSSTLGLISLSDPTGRQAGWTPWRLRFRQGEDVRPLEEHLPGICR